MSRNRNYKLRYAQGQQFYGYDTPAAVLTAMANFDNENGNRTNSVSLGYNVDDNTWSGTLLWEDC